MRTTGNAPVFQVPRRNKPSARVWVAVLLCVLVPPLGLVMLWRGVRCPVRGKLLITAVAFVSLTVMLTVYIRYQMTSGILVPQQAAGQFAENDYTGAAGASVTAATATATPAPAEPSETPAPANPNG
jgi:hypothetical protein